MRQEGFVKFIVLKR